MTRGTPIYGNRLYFGIYFLQMSIAEAKDLTAALHAACSEGHRKLVAPLCKGKADVKLGAVWATCFLFDRR